MVCSTVELSKQVSASRSYTGWLTVCSHRAEWPKHFMCKPLPVWQLSDVMKKSWQAECSHSRCSPTLQGPEANAPTKYRSGNQRQWQNTSGVNDHWKGQAPYLGRMCVVEGLLTGATIQTNHLNWCNQRKQSSKYLFCKMVVIILISSEIIQLVVPVNNDQMLRERERKK